MMLSAGTYGLHARLELLSRGTEICEDELRGTVRLSVAGPCGAIFVAWLQAGRRAALRFAA